MKNWKQNLKIVNCHHQYLQRGWMSTTVTAKEAMTIAAAQHMSQKFFSLLHLYRLRTAYLCFHPKQSMTIDRNIITIVAKNMLTALQGGC